MKTLNSGSIKAKISQLQKRADALLKDTKRTWDESSLDRKGKKYSLSCNLGDGLGKAIRQHAAANPGLLEKMTKAYEYHYGEKYVPPTAAQILASKK